MEKNCDIQRNIFSYTHAGAGRLLLRIQVKYVRTTAYYTIALFMLELRIAGIASWLRSELVLGVRVSELLK